MRGVLSVRTPFLDRFFQVLWAGRNDVEPMEAEYFLALRKNVFDRDSLSGNAASTASTRSNVFVSRVQRAVNIGFREGAVAFFTVAFFT